MMVPPVDLVVDAPRCFVLRRSLLRSDLVVSGNATKKIQDHVRIITSLNERIETRDYQSEEQQRERSFIRNALPFDAHRALNVHSLSREAPFASGHSFHRKNIHRISHDRCRFH